MGKIFQCWVERHTGAVYGLYTLTVNALIAHALVVHAGVTKALVVDARHQQQLLNHTNARM